MNAKKLNQLVEEAKSNLGKSLLSTSIWDEQGQIITGFRDDKSSKTATLSNSVTAGIRKTLEFSNFPKLRDYYMIDLKNNVKVLLCFHKEYTWAISVSNEVKLGMFLEVYWKEGFDMFKEAIDE